MAVNRPYMNLGVKSNTVFVTGCLLLQLTADLTMPWASAAAAWLELCCVALSVHWPNCTLLFIRSCIMVFCLL